MSNGRAKVSTPGFGGMVRGFVSDLGRTARNMRRVGRGDLIGAAEDFQASTEGAPGQRGIREIGQMGSDIRGSATGAASSYDPLIQQQQQMARLRAEEGRLMDQYLRRLEGVPDELREEQQTATQEMRRQAALRMAQQGGRGNVIGAMSMAKGVGQEAANIGTQFGAQIRDAARQAAQARIERQQQAIESMTKPGVDVERISGSLVSAATRAREAGSPNILKAEIEAMEQTTDDPLAIQLIETVKSNLSSGRPAFTGTSLA